MVDPPLAERNLLGITAAHDRQALVTCENAIEFADKCYDIIFDLRKRHLGWDQEAVAHTPTLVSSLHEFTVSQADDGAITFTGRVDPDFWVVVSGTCPLA